MSEISIQAKRRALSTKGAVNKARREGDVPAIYYTKDTEPIPIVLPEISLKPLVYTSETHIVDLQIDDEKESKKSILKGIQFDPVSDRIIHCDFLGISLDEEIEIEVPIALKGTAKGIKEGGIIQQSIHKVRISCLPNYIPDHITIEVTDLGLGNAIHVKDLKIDNVTFLQNEEVIIVSVVHPRAVAETTAVEDQEIKEPEVISKGKAEEEE